MAQDDTVRKLADMTDEGAFERLATAVLRQSDSRFRSLSHPGVNADGKTVKSPVDGIAFVPGANPAQMIAVHHTICAAKDLEKKWLHDPATVVPRGKSKRPTAPAGDIVKTVEIVAEERKRTPDVQATLILTTNQEPGETLVRNVHAAAAAAGITIDIWARSRLADVLDNEPRGQWLRRQFLGIDQVQLSKEMLTELSQRSLELSKPPDRPDAWVERALDRAIGDADDEQIVFVIGESGSGKSIACYKRLSANAAAGGFSIILTDEAIASSLSLEQALEKSLLQLHPSLIAGCGGTALQLSRSDRRLMVAIEDINRSGLGAALIEKVARWQSDKSKDGTSSWQLLCPVWPQVMSSLGDEARKRINSRAIVGTVFSPEEGAEAVERRRALGGRPVTRLEAASISEALGHDPLLIALHDPASTPDTAQTIGQFIETSLQRLAATKGEFSAAEYGQALGALATTMLLNRQMEPGWIELLAWPALTSHAASLRHLVHQGEIVRLTGPSTSEKLAFRHDRVREWLLAGAASEFLRANSMPTDIAAEPYFAEIFGLALTREDASASAVSMMASHNALALFCAVRHLPRAAPSVQTGIISALETWLGRTSANVRGERYLRWEAMRTLAEAEGPHVRPFVARFDDNSWNALRARYRNGDLMGGIGLCLQIEPGVSVAGHEAFLDHVKTRFGANLVSALAATLSKEQLDETIRIGALRLAGHIGEPALAAAVRACWHNHVSRDQHLDEYLWACAQCVDDDPASLLGPVCDGWATLPDTTKDKGMPSPRDDLAAHNVRWAFHKRLPERAIRYFIERAAGPDLRWPITYMLHGLDQPDAVEFVVRELAATDERLEGTNSFSPFGMSANGDWQRRQEETGRAMSVASRKRLLDIWQDQTAGKHLRKQAFRIWAATHRAGDIDILRTVPNADALADNALWQRLRLGDREAIPAMIVKLSADDRGYWWQLGRYIWSDDVTKALDEALERRGAALGAAGSAAVKRADADAFLSEMVMRLPTAEADALLNKHWDHLAASHYYVIAALYVATPALQAHVAASIKAASEPKELLRHLSIRFGHKRSGHPGLFRSEQIEAVVPYLDLVDEMDIYHLWNACNEHGWFDLRRTYLDPRLPSKVRDRVYLDEGRVLKALDEFLAKNDPWLDHWLDEFRKSGASLDDIMALIARWLEQKSSIDALEIASRAVLHLGERRHLGLLKAVKIDPGERAAAIVADTEFGVKRRTLRHPNG
jgi:hypothetical protein